jgi:hypothetical protein
MAAKSNGEIKAVIDKSIADAAKNRRLRKALSENHLKVLSQPPYGLTLEDFITAHDTHPNLRPAGSGPWGSDQTSGKDDRDGDEASRQDDPGFAGQPSGKGDRDPWGAGQPSGKGDRDPLGAGQTSGKGPRRSDGGQSRGGGHRGTRG